MNGSSVFQVRELQSIRLARSPHRERFVLKGAQLFRIWGADGHRPTRDLDLLGFGDASEEAMEPIFTELMGMAVDPPDGLEWKGIKVGSIRDDITYGGVRVTLSATLAGARLSLQIDVGFGDAITPEAREEGVAEYARIPIRTSPDLPSGNRRRRET